jgi:hypothetical protein
MFPPRYFGSRFFPARYFGVGFTSAFLPAWLVNLNTHLGQTPQDPQPD